MARRVRHWLHVRRIQERGSELELLHRSMGFGALGLVTLVPLLIVVAAADPFRHRGFALWLVDGMALSGRSADTVERIFTAPRQAVATTGAVSLIALAVFGLSFAGSVQTGYEKTWSLSVGPWHRAWRQTVWLAVLMAYLYAEVQSRGTVPEPLRIVLNLLVGVGFFWWGQRFLLGEQVSWRALLPGAVATMAGLVGLRAFSYLVFAPLIVSNAVSYGAVGAVLIVECWLVGVGFVVFGGALLGRHFHEHPERHVFPRTRHIRHTRHVHHLQAPRRPRGSTSEDAEARDGETRNGDGRDGDAPNGGPPPGEPPRAP
ncbi:YihY/virulence factor BrkB family protein [Streptomyces sp. Ru73]|uniref:YihY/virulence factor BrkB family protein n=1 Tax=Streptomyces sp. Ru73 TaxID=2080748 RepID=UPI0021564B4B|nr:YihY/virulence factor BrkB family protein [Streptomyces sp. Ru73]